MIKFQDLEIGFKEKSIFRQLNGSIQKGQLIALVGINGVGKSCFMKTLAKLIQPIRGGLFLNDLNYNTLKSQDFAKEVSIVLTEKVDVDFLNVTDLIEQGLSPFSNFFGAVPQHFNQKKSDAIELLGLQHLSMTYFSDLSDGQKQKVLIARALVQAQSFLFLDEPTTFLDLPSKIELLKILKTISAKKRIGVLFSTHDINLISNEIDQVWLLDDVGELHKKSPEEMLHSGLYKKHFNFEVN
jgi:iron complex transport system ATP-binding protein